MNRVLFIGVDWKKARKYLTKYDLQELGPKLQDLEEIDRMFKKEL